MEALFQGGQFAVGVAEDEGHERLVGRHLADPGRNLAEVGLPPPTTLPGFFAPWAASPPPGALCGAPPAPPRPASGPGRARTGHASGPPDRMPSPPRRWCRWRLRRRPGRFGAGW